MKSKAKVALVFCAIFNCLAVGAANALTNESVIITRSNGTTLDDLDGQSLYDMGLNLNKPLLMLLGKTIKNFEEKVNSQMCHPFPCTEWTEWSGCDARANEFGARYRSRKCGMDKLTCKLKSEHRIEEESKICVFLCPPDYNITENGFCIKLYADKERNRDEADAKCQDDGGYLINIDSETKYKDVNDMVEGISGGMWIDGKRKNYKSPWEYKYGSKTGFFKWYSGQPDNTSDMCLVVASGSSGIVWHDFTCSYEYLAICEIFKLQI